MTSPLASFLEGLTGGFEGGYGLRQDRDDRRRKRETDDRERQRREFERGRGDVERAQDTGIDYVPSRAPDEVGRFDEAASRLRRDTGNALMPRTDRVAPGGFAGARELPGQQHDMLDRSLAMPRIRGIEDRIQFGGFEQVRPSRAEQHDIDESAHNAELAAAVGNYLSKSRPELGITPGTQEATLLGMGKIPLHEPRDRNIDPLSPEGIKARLDYDRQRVRSGGDADLRQDLGSVERQVDDTRSDLSRAEREMPTRGPLTDYDPEANRRFVADSSAAAGRVESLQARADSLGGVRDSIAARVQGRAPTTKSPAQWVTEVRREHPGWSPEQVAAEARRRAGAR